MVLKCRHDWETVQPKISLGTGSDSATPDQQKNECLFSQFDNSFWIYSSENVLIGLTVRTPIILNRTSELILTSFIIGIFLSLSVKTGIQSWLQLGCYFSSRARFSNITHY